jgi:alcohol dehydrogenase
LEINKQGLFELLSWGFFRHNLAKTVKNGNDLKVREKVVFGNTLSGLVMSVGAWTSEHSLEHALSAYHQELPHGAGLIMISQAYYSHLINKRECNTRFVEMAQAMGMEKAKKPLDFITMLVKLQQDCGVASLKMSDFGIKPNEFETLAKNAKYTIGGLFNCDRSKLSLEDCVNIYKDSYQ